MSKSIEKQLDTRDLEDFKRSLSRLKGQGNLDEEYDICTSIGDLYVKTGKLHKSLEYFFSALSIAKAMKNSDLKCDAFHSIAGILSDSSICLWDKALMYVNFQLSECDRTSKSTGGKSLSIDSAQERFLDAANVKANRQAAYFQQGLIYMQRDDNLAGIFSKIYLQEAKRAFSSALSELECFEETTEVLRMKANTFLNLALTYERLEDTSNSELYFSNSFSVANAIQDDEALARFYTNRGMKLLEERNFVATEKAWGHLDKAMESLHTCMATLRISTNSSDAEFSFFASLINERISEIELLLDKRASAASLISAADSTNEAIPWSKCTCEIKCTGLCFLQVSTDQPIVSGDILLSAAICCQSELKQPLDAIRYLWPLFSQDSSWEIGSVLGRSFAQLRLWSYAYDTWKVQSSRDAHTDLEMLQRAESYLYLCQCYRNLGNIPASKDQLDLSIAVISQILGNETGEYFNIAMLMSHYLQVVKGGDEKRLQERFPLVQQAFYSVDITSMTQKTGLEVSKYCSLISSTPLGPCKEDLEYVEWLESSFDYFGERKPTKSIQSLASSGMVLQSKKHGKKVGLKLGKFSNAPDKERKKISSLAYLPVKSFASAGKFFRSQFLAPKKSNINASGDTHQNARAVDRLINKKPVVNDEEYNSQYACDKNYRYTRDNFDCNGNIFDKGVLSRNPISSEKLTSFIANGKEEEDFCPKKRINTKPRLAIILSDDESKEGPDDAFSSEAINRHKRTIDDNKKLENCLFGKPVTKHINGVNDCTSLRPAQVVSPSIVVKIRWEDSSRRIISIPLSSLQVSSMNVGDLVLLLSDGQKRPNLRLCLSDGSELLLSTSLGLVLSLPESSILILHEEAVITSESALHTGPLPLPGASPPALPNASPLNLCKDNGICDASEKKMAKRYEACCKALNFPFMPKMYDILDKMADSIILNGEILFSELIDDPMFSLAPVLAALQGQNDVDLISISDLRLDFSLDITNICCKRLTISRCLLASNLKILSCFQMSTISSLDLSHNLITDDVLFLFLDSHIRNGDFCSFSIRGNLLEGLSSLKEWSQFVSTATISSLDVSHNDKLSLFGLSNLVLPFKTPRHALDKVAIGPLFCASEICNNRLVDGLLSVLVFVSCVEVFGPFPCSVLERLLNALVMQDTRLASLSLINCGLTTELSSLMSQNCPVSSGQSKKCTLNLSGNPDISSYNMLGLDICWQFIAFDRCNLDAKRAVTIIHNLGVKCKYLSLCWNPILIRNFGDFTSILDGIVGRKGLIIDISFSFVSTEVLGFLRLSLDFQSSSVAVEFPQRAPRCIHLHRAFGNVACPHKMSVIAINPCPLIYNPLNVATVRFFSVYCPYMLL